MLYIIINSTDKISGSQMTLIECIKLSNFIFLFEKIYCAIVEIKFGLPKLIIIVLSVAMKDTHQ